MFDVVHAVEKLQCGTLGTYGVDLQFVCRRLISVFQTSPGPHGKSHHPPAVEGIGIPEQKVAVGSILIDRHDEAAVGFSSFHRERIGVMEHQRGGIFFALFGHDIGVHTP